MGIPWWLVLLAALVIGVTTQYGITTLHDHASEQRNSEILIAHIDSLVQRASLWERSAIARGVVTPEIETAISGLNAQTDQLLAQLRDQSQHNGTRGQLETDVAAYQGSVAEEFRLVKQPDVSRARAHHEAQVVPALDRLEATLTEAGGDFQADAERADRTASFGSAAVLLLAAGALALLVWRSTRTRHAADALIAEQRALQESESRFRALVQHSSDAITVVDEHGTIRYQSAEGQAAAGLGSGTIGASIYSLVETDSLPAMHEAFTQALSAPRASASVTVRCAAEDGAERYFELVVTNLLATPGVAGIVVNSREVTERIRAEEELREREERFNHLMRHTSDIISVYDSEGNLTYMSPSCERITGYTAQELIESPRTYFKMFVTAGREQTMARWERLRDTRGLGSPAEIVLRTREGEIRTLETQANNLLDDPRMNCIIVNSRDITERKRAQEAALESEASFRLLFAGNPLAMCVFDRDSLAFLEVNDAACAQYGYTRAELLTMSLADLLTADDREHLLDAVGHTGPVLRRLGQWRHLRRDGALLYVEMTSHAMEFGGRSATLVVAQDITERKQAEAALQQAEKLSALGELAAGMAHEINNPLATVAGTAELLLRGDLSESQREDLTLVHQESRRAGDIVTALLRFARQREPSRAPVQAEAVIYRALALVGDRLRRHEIDFGLQTAPVPDLMADEDQLLQVFVNLINNAVDAMGTSDTRNLTVSIQPAATGVEVAVEDSGPGIPLATMARIFDPFFTTKPTGQGTGLGLSVCHRIVADHGGSVMVENLARGGAAFRIVLPIPADAASSGERPAVAIVHADALAADLLAEAVRLLDFEAYVVTSAEDVDTLAPVAAFVDPATSGALVEQLAASRPALRLIATSPPEAGHAWYAVLPAAYSLSDLQTALEGAA